MVGTLVPRSPHPHVRFGGIMKSTRIICIIIAALTAYFSANTVMSGFALKDMAREDFTSYCAFSICFSSFSCVLSFTVCILLWVFHFRATPQFSPVWNKFVCWTAATLSSLAIIFLTVLSFIRLIHMCKIFINVGKNLISIEKADMKILSMVTSSGSAGLTLLLCLLILSMALQTEKKTIESIASTDGVPPLN